MKKHNWMKIPAALLLLGIGVSAMGGAELQTGPFTFGAGKKGYLFLPENFRPGGEFQFILFMHGRGGVPGTAGNFGTPAFAGFRKLCSEKGYVVAVPPLRSHWYNGQSEKDVEAMLDFLADKLKLDLRRFHVMGCSMGGMAALLYAGRHSERVITLCDIFGPFDLKTFAGGEYKENIKAAYGGYYEQKKAFYESRNPENYAGVLKNIPLLAIHGEADRKVPFEHSVLLAETIRKMGGKSFELVAVPKIGHNNAIINGLEVKIIDFMEKHR